MTESPNSAAVVVDASIVAMWVLPEPHTARALALAFNLLGAGIDLLAPPLMQAEVTNAVYKRVRRGEMDLDRAREALDIVASFGVQILSTPDLYRSALGLARRFGRSASYDACYLALAESRGCEVWTGDERLYNAVRSELPWVRWVGSYSGERDPAN